MLKSISLSQIREYALQYVSEYNANELSIEFIDIITERAVLAGSNLVYKDPFIIAQLESGVRGACFLHPGDICEHDLDNIVGKSLIEVIDKVKQPIEIACLDAFFELLNIKEGISPNKVLEINGLAHDKSQRRAREIIRQAAVKEQQNLLFIGVIADLVSAAIQIGAEIKLADFALSGSRIHDLDVEYDSIPMLSWADNIIMTGNTLKTNTLTELLEIIRSNGTPLLIYAMTGANIAPRYLNFGANVVTCERFPFYWYSNLTTLLSIYRNDQ